VSELRRAHSDFDVQLSGFTTTISKRWQRRWLIRNLGTYNISCCDYYINQHPEISDSVEFKVVVARSDGAEKLHGIGMVV
jgi:hypothetical protein